MKKIISLLLALMMLFGSMLALVSCGAPADDGAEIRIYLGSEITDLDPTDYYVNNNAEQLMSLMFEPLFKLNANGGLECAQAESYTVDTLTREIVIQLRETYWSDDSRVKAEDFVYTWSERLLNPNNPNPAAALLYDIENAAAIKGGVAGFTASDLAAKCTGTYEITINYREGADYMQLLRNLASVATSPIRRSAFESAPTYWSKNALTAVSNGPFHISRINSVNNELALSRNKGYHQKPDVVDYDNIVIPGQLVGFYTAYGETVEVSYADIENKTVFYMMDAPVGEKLASSAKTVKKDDTSVYTYVFNTEHPLFKDANVRQALSLVIDRAAIVAAIGEGIAADGFVPTVSGGSSEALIGAADKDAAEALLADVDLTGVNKSFTLTVENTEKAKAVAALVEEAWESLSIGLKVTVKAVDTTVSTLPPATKDGEPTEIVDSTMQVLVKEASYGKRDFDVLAVDWQTYSDDSFVALASLTSGFNGNGKDFATGIVRKSISGWTDSHYDHLMTEAFKASGEKRSEYLEEAEEYLVSAAPIVPIFFNQNVTFVSSELSGITYDLFGNAIFTKTAQRNYQTYLEKED